jgi:hypothetical protein
MRQLHAIASLLVVVTGCVVTEVEHDSSLLVDNQSDFEVHEMYVTDISSPSWGPNLLDGDILFPGDMMYVGVECGTYDALLIDETDATCEVNNISLCFEDVDWIIRNSTCAVFE